MIPATVTQLPVLPRTIAGKLDRAALPSVDNLRAAVGMVPRDAREHAVAQAFEAVLQRSGVGAHDSFSALGGDSLSAIKVASRLHRCGLGIGLRDLLRLDTVAAIAAAVHEFASEAAPVKGLLPLTPIQRWFFDEHTQSYDHLNHAVLLRAAQRLQETPLRCAFDATSSQTALCASPRSRGAAERICALRRRSSG